MRSADERKKMIDIECQTLSLSKQLEVLSLNKSRLYYIPAGEKAENLSIMRFLDEQYFRTPFYGVLRLRALLKENGYSVSSKRVRRLMKTMGWQTIYREPKTTLIEKGSYKYPYLLKGLQITKVNQVWAMDITYIPMKKGFMYLTAIIDLYSRYVVGWSLSNTMSGDWCAQVLQETIREHGKPEIFNTDQGSQFTSDAFTNTLRDNGIRISMDGKGRALDNIFIERLWRNVKYENIYLNVYEDGLSLWKGLNDYFQFYNGERLHQSLDYKTPEKIYKTAC